MKLPNLSQPVIRTVQGVPKSTGVMPSVDTACVIEKCGLGAVSCIPAYLSGGLPGVLKCLGSAAPGCISCFIGS